MQHRTHLKGARRLGSAKSGTHHWWMQRISAIALVPLSLWFVINAALFARSDYIDVLIWTGQAWNAIALALLVVMTFYHAVLGLQVVIEDYIHCEVIKLTSLLAIKFAAVISVAGALWAILRIAI